MTGWTEADLNLKLKNNPQLEIDFNASTLKKKREAKPKQKELPLESDELFERRFKHRDKIRLESVIQIDFVKWIRRNRGYYPQLAAGFAVPNGGKRPPKTAKTMKAEGEESGVSDYIILCPARGKSGLVIEFKRQYEQPSDNQKYWLNMLAENGFHTAVCWSKRDAIELITWFYDLPEGLIEE